MKHNSIYIIWIPEEKTGKGEENLSEERVAENVPIPYSLFWKKQKSRCRRHRDSPNKIYPRRPMAKHIKP